MLLSDFMSALKTTGVKVTLFDTEGKELIKFFSEGYTSVESEILARTVKRFELTSATSISIVLSDFANAGTSSATLYNP